MGRQTLRIATIGSFDGVHRGHAALLNELRALAAEHSLKPLVITFDPLPSQVLGGGVSVPLLTTSGERITLIKEQGIEEVLVMRFDQHLAEHSAELFMKTLKERYTVRTLLLGYDHRFGRDGMRLSVEQYQALGKQQGMDVLCARALYDEGEPISSSRIRQALLSGRPELAARLLGRPYSLSGQVVDGLHIGRGLGYPTANIRPNAVGKLIPSDGVYAVRIHLLGSTCSTGAHGCPGMLSIGNRPTLGEGLARTIEVHILGLHADLYAQPVEIEFLAYLRPNKRFPSLEELKHQLEADEASVRDFFRVQDNK